MLIESLQFLVNSAHTHSPNTKKIFNNRLWHTFLQESKPLLVRKLLPAHLAQREGGRAARWAARQRAGPCSPPCSVLACFAFRDWRTVVAFLELPALLIRYHTELMKTFPQKTKSNINNLSSCALVQHKHFQRRRSFAMAQWNFL